MTYQLVGKKLENGSFKLAVVQDGEFMEAESDAKLESYVTKAVTDIAAEMPVGERVTVTIVTGSGESK